MTVVIVVVIVVTAAVVGDIGNCVVSGGVMRMFRG